MRGLVKMELVGIENSLKGKYDFTLKSLKNDDARRLLLSDMGMAALAGPAKRESFFRQLREQIGETMNCGSNAVELLRQIWPKGKWALVEENPAVAVPWSVLTSTWFVHTRRGFVVYRAGCAQPIKSYYELEHMFSYDAMEMAPHPNKNKSTFKILTDLFDQPLCEFEEFDGQYALQEVKL